MNGGGIDLGVMSTFTIGDDIMEILCLRIGVQGMLMGAKHPLFASAGCSFTHEELQKFHTESLTDSHVVFELELSDFEGGRFEVGGRIVMV